MAEGTIVIGGRTYRTYEPFDKSYGERKVEVITDDGIVWLSEERARRYLALFDHDLRESLGSIFTGLKDGFEFEEHEAFEIITEILRPTGLADRERKDIRQRLATVL